MGTCVYLQCVQVGSIISKVTRGHVAQQFNWVYGIMNEEFLELIKLVI